MVYKERKGNRDGYMMRNGIIAREFEIPGKGTRYVYPEDRRIILASLSQSGYNRLGIYMRSGGIGRR